MENLQKEFVPYELALKLKLIGFDEPCLAVYRGGSLYGSGTSVNRYYDDGDWKLEKNSNYGGKIYHWVSAPTFSQVFKWFRHKNYKTSICFDVDVSTGETLYEYEIFKDKQFMFETDFIYNEYEEAELACLEKLLEIIENNKN